MNKHFSFRIENPKLGLALTWHRFPSTRSLGRYMDSEHVVCRVPRVEEFRGTVIRGTEVDTDTCLRYRSLGICIVSRGSPDDERCIAVHESEHAAHYVLEHLRRRKLLPDNWIRSELLAYVTEALSFIYLDLMRQGFPETVDTRRMAKWFRLLGGLPKKEFWDYVR